ncbi:MAG: DEAD/DEAH box helicase [Planctomycetes bacterium]|nr:DEAD/DEAH box helicase [Planctomycetota bacterium]
MPLSGFHPAVRAWFAATLGEPTAPQLRGWPVIRSGGNALIAAPTGTGKTLAAFLIAIDQLVQHGPLLPQGTQVLYVSPLKALGNDIEKNLQVPLAGIRALDASVPEIRVLVRTGDTPASQRAKMVRSPPHILVTTPESLYILLTSEGGRGILGSVRTVIVDEIHALAGDKRGAHLALSLERLEALVAATGHAPLQRIGLSATQKPLEDIARFLVGTERACEVVDAGHLRRLDLGVELPSSPLEAVCSNEVWAELYERMAVLIAEHRTTLVFVNTRKLAERVAARLSERLGPERVACHHGSLSKERRFDAEQRLKAGSLAVLVATASLELGIDIGDVDLVLQVGSCRAIATFLQRVGRAGHGVARTPKGRLFPLTIDELAEGAALLRAVAAGELDRIPQPVAPRDILAQQVVAACVAESWDEDGLFALVTRAWPYRALPRDAFDRVLALHATGRGLVHRDGVNRRVRGTRRTRLVAVTSGGAIPDTAQYQVREEPSGNVIGSLDEDFSIESSAGDIIQLGNTSWRILRIESREGIVRVADARGALPTIPFWFGEAPSRTRELSAAVAALREDCTGMDWLERSCGLPPAGAQQVWDLFESGRKALGSLPTQRSVIAERFFDDSGGQQLVIHAPFGGRINRAWGLALRKRICGGFGFELEAAATEDAIIISLAPTTSFPLDDIFSFLSPVSVRALLIQACITGGQFETRWRWNATRALVVARFSGGKKVPAYLSRIRANDALAAAFPGVLACPETLPGGPIELPEGHPLVDQTIEDCLTELMDVDGLIEVLEGIRSGAIATRAVEVAEPSPFAAAILAAKPYAFLDDTPLEERRTRAVSARARPGEAAPAIVELDPEVVAGLARDVWPDPRDLEEVHEALLWMGFVADDEAREWNPWLDQLAEAGRVMRSSGRWYAVEASGDPIEVMRGRLEALGPIRSDDPVLLALEQEGIAVRTRLGGEPAWCHRRLLARIHRAMRDRARARVEPATAAEFLRFLAAWQGVDPDRRREGPRGLAAVIDQLAGFEATAPAWSARILPERVREFRHEWLDQLCLAGEFAWGRLWSTPSQATPASPLADPDGPADAAPLRPATLHGTPICWVRREHLDQWLAIAPTVASAQLSDEARRVLDALSGGALFHHELSRKCALESERVEVAQVELIARGLITCDAFGALRHLMLSSERRARAQQPGGRWSLLRPHQARTAMDMRTPAYEDAALFVARQLLRRTGVVFRQTIARERQPIAWRDLLRALRILELRGEVQGGRFVSGFSGEQYALPEAAEQLRRVRRSGEAAARDVSAADPLNFRGILTPDERVRPVIGRRVLVG